MHQSWQLKAPHQYGFLRLSQLEAEGERLQEASLPAGSASVRLEHAGIFPGLEVVTRLLQGLSDPGIKLAIDVHVSFTARLKETGSDDFEALVPACGG